MAAVTHVCTIDCVAKMLSEDVELLQAITCNDDNLTHGNIMSVYRGPEETIFTLTDERSEKPRDMIRAAWFHHQKRAPPQEIASAPKIFSA
ncbi:hypothetical protein ROLI_002400 [Roseobacter fucihabitans]|uniref:Uncharacterized protein n=2 Tax=Roseobacter fucihabitans TaxID=1537242 RepID=A0ABZ2BNZ5_9RHOB|nr:hypothetical protein [Roseobacter litoralis]MBC6963491.1 hypothetical protein [Roseobacter litoralis]